MSETSFVIRQEQEIYRQFDNQRRIRLARLIAPASFVLSGSVGLVLVIYLLFHLHPLDSFVVLLTFMSWLVAGCDVLSVIAARRGHANLTAFGVCGGVLLAIGALLAYSLGTTGLNTFSFLLLFALSLVIVISGVLGSTLLLIAVTVALILGGSGVLAANAQSPVLGENAFIIALVYVAMLSTIGVMMVIFRLGYQQTLRELGEARVAYEQARQLDDLKNQFIVNVNHELRNPVMAMMGHLDILDMSLETAPRERLQKLTQGAIRASENLRALLASILDASRMEQGTGDFAPEPIPLVKAILSAAELISPSEGDFQGRELRLYVPEKLTAWGEPVRFQQIMTNLISNALKYSGHGTPIEVRARVVSDQAPGFLRRKRPVPEQPQEWVEITVRDWGLGIPPEQIPLLFQRFVRLPRDLASTVIGNGLGLHLCKVCAEAMKGSIWVESSGVEGEGSTFYVRLPHRSKGFR